MSVGGAFRVSRRVVGICGRGFRLLESFLLRGVECFGFLHHSGGDFAGLLVEVNTDGVAGVQFGIDNQLCQRVLEIFLNRTLERTGTVLLVVALVGDEVLGIVGDIEGVSHQGHTAAESAKLYVDNL